MGENEDHVSVNYITMWTAQTKRVLETLDRDGVYYVKKSYIAEKYGSTAWVFQKAYRFFTEKAESMLEKPGEAESPVWMFCDKKWALPGHDAYCIELKIPRNEVLLFDLRLWSKVLNLSYMGTGEQEKAFERKLRQMGVSNSSDVFEKPYYPALKAEIIKSWERLFSAECPEMQYAQGAAWMIRKEWVVQPDGENQEGMVL